MSDSDDKWQGRPILFLPANEAAAAQFHRPPGLHKGRIRGSIFSFWILLWMINILRKIHYMFPILSLYFRSHVNLYIYISTYIYIYIYLHIYMCFLGNQSWTSMSYMSHVMSLLVMAPASIYWRSSKPWLRREQEPEKVCCHNASGGPSLPWFKHVTSTQQFPMPFWWCPFFPFLRINILCEKGRLQKTSCLTKAGIRLTCSTPLGRWSPLPTANMFTNHWWMWAGPSPSHVIFSSNFV